MNTRISFAQALRSFRRPLWAIPILTLLLGVWLFFLPTLATGNLGFSALVGFMALFMIASYDWRDYRTNQALFMAYWIVVVAELLIVGLPTAVPVATMPQASLGGVSNDLILAYFPAVYMIIKIALLQPLWSVWRISARYRFNTS